MTDLPNDGWVDAPPDAPRTRDSKWKRFTLSLRERPGAWRQAPGDYSQASATNLRARYPEYEWVSRVSEPGSQFFHIYGRYNP